MKSIKESVVFQETNNLVNLLSQIAEFNDKCTIVTPEELNFQLQQIKMSRTLPLKTEVVDAFVQGKIKIGYSQSLQLPSTVTYMPFPAKTSSGMVILINATDFMRYDDREEAYSINPNTLHNLLIGAYSVAACLANERAILNDYDFRLGTCTLMTKLFTNVLMRDTSLASADATQLIQFLFAKFVHCGLFGLDLKGANEFAVRATGYDNIDKISFLDLNYDDNAFCKLDTFIEILSKEFKQLRNYNVMDLVRAWTNYGQPAILAIDYLPYTLALIMSAPNGFAIYRANKLKALVGKETALLAKRMTNKISQYHL